jgi:hypothetical protein
MSIGLRKTSADELYKSWKVGAKSQVIDLNINSEFSTFRSPSNTHKSIKSGGFDVGK